MKNKRKSSFKDDSQLYEAPAKKYTQTAPPEKVDVDAVIECWKRKRMKNKLKTKP